MFPQNTKHYQALVAGLALTACSCATLVHTLPDRKIGVEAHGQTTLFKGAPVFGAPGKPKLPQVSVSFLVPANADISDMSVSLHNLTLDTLPGSYNVEPAGEWQYGNQVLLTNSNIVNGKDTTVYNSDAFYPQRILGTHTVGHYRQYKLVDVLINPYQYNPQTKQLCRVSGGSVTLENIAYGPTTRGGSISSSEAAYIQKLVVNPAELQSYGAVSRSAENPVYAIITTNEIKNGSRRLTDFIQSKEDRGFTVKVYTENQWGDGSSTGDVAANLLREWLRANYETEDIDYVLLLGNPDPESGDVPMKLCHSLDFESTLIGQQIPTDFFYADLTNTWDFDGDGRYGEHYEDGGGGLWVTTDVGDYGRNGQGIDKHGEVHVGRISYYGNMEDLDYILYKSIVYENEKDISWRKHALLPMEPTGKGMHAFGLGENIKDDILTPTGDWTYTRVYDEINKYNDQATGAANLSPLPDYLNCDTKNVLEAWLAKPTGVTAWHTHGSPTSATSIMYSENSYKLDEKHPTISAMASCSNADPSATDNLAYTMLKTGGIASLAATEVTWGKSGENSFTNTTSAGGIVYKFAKQIISNDLAVGPAFTATRSDLSPTYHFWWMNTLGFNLYGDPALGLSTTGDGFYDPTEYTIGTGGDFASFTEAVAYLKLNGITTNTTFKVKSGTYNEAIEIPEIAGVTEKFQIVFQSETGNPDDVILTGAGCASNTTLTLDGADYLTFKNLTITNDSEPGNRVVFLENGATYNIFNSNTLQIRNLDMGIVADFGTDAGNDNNSFINNTLFGPLVFSRDKSTTESLHNRFINNTMSGSGMFAMAKLKKAEITGNKMHARVYGVSLRDCQDILVNKNYISACRTGIKVYSGWDAKVINNYIHAGGTYGPNQENLQRRGILLDYTYRANVANNTVIMRNKNTGEALYTEYTRYANIRNNIFMTRATKGIAANFNHGDNDLRVDYNNYYTDPAATEAKMVVISGTEHSTINDAVGLNSLNVDPQFAQGAGTAPYMVTNSALQSGTPIVEVVDDIDGRLRDETTPTIGAWEMPSSRQLPREYRFSSENGSGSSPYDQPPVMLPCPGFVDIDFTLPVHIKRDTALTFVNSSHYNYALMTWYINDQEVTTARDLTKTFTATGIYTVTLTGVRFDGVHETVRKIFEVVEPSVEIFAETFDDFYNSYPTNNGWEFYVDNAAASEAWVFDHTGGNDKKAHIYISNEGSESWHVHYRQTGITLEQGKRYILRFKAATEVGNSRSIKVLFEQDATWDQYNPTSEVTIDGTLREYEVAFTMHHRTDWNAIMVFEMGALRNAHPSDVILDDIVLIEK